MAKHDQTVLKFIAQNSDSAPTLINMMTKLKINVSDITDSLADLLAQNAIGKGTNEQGMETWFVASRSVEIPKPADVITKDVEAIPKVADEIAKAVGEITKVVDPIPDPVVQKSEIQKPAITESAPQPIPNFSAMPIYPAPANKGVGVFTFAIGLVIVSAFSIWMGTRLTNSEIKKATKDFVDQKAFSDIGNAYLESEDKSKAELNALKTEVKTLNAQLAFIQGVTDSLKVALTTARMEKSTAKSRKAKSANRR
jgi:outer membrane murein-binding lipoprotein Lpp